MTNKQKQVIKEAFGGFRVRDLMKQLDSNKWRGRIFFSYMNLLNAINYTDDFANKNYDAIEDKDALNTWLSFENLLVDEYALIVDEIGLHTPYLFIKIYTNCPPEEDKSDARLTVKELFNWSDLNGYELCFRQMFTDSVGIPSAYNTYLPINNLVINKLHKILKDVRIINSTNNIKDEKMAYIEVGR